MNGIRIARNTSAAAVAAIAAWSSYSHAVHVALHYGERAEVAYALPFSVDGMLVVASVAMVDDRRGGRHVRPVARIAFGAGVIASVAANIGAAHPTVGARIVAAWPALALLLVVEMLSRPGRPAEQPLARQADRAKQPAEPTAEPPVPRPARIAEIRNGWAEHPAEDPAEPAAAAVLPVATLRGPHQPPPAHPGRQAEPDTPQPPEVTRLPVAEHAATGSTRSRPEHAEHRAGGRQVPPTEPVRRGTPAATRRGEGHRSEGPAKRRRPTAVTRQIATQLMTSQTHLSRGEIAAQLGVSTRRLREVLAAQP